MYTKALPKLKAAQKGWNPDVKTDSTGKAHVSFYNSDLEGKALIRISGVSYQIKDASAAVSQYLSG